MLQTSDRLAKDIELIDVNEHHEVAVTYFSKPETYMPANNMEDQVAYSVQVLLVRNLGQNNFKGLADLLKDRQLLGQSLPVAGPGGDPCGAGTAGCGGAAGALEQEYDCSTIVFRRLSEQPAGIF